MKTATFRKATALILTLTMLMTCVGAWATTETTTVVVNANTEDKDMVVEAIEVIEVTPAHDRTVGLEVLADGHEAEANVEKGIVAQGENNPGEKTLGTAGVVMGTGGDGSEVEVEIGSEGISVRDSQRATGIDINMSNNSEAEVEVAGSVEAIAESSSGDSAYAAGVGISFEGSENCDVVVEIGGHISATGNTTATGLSIASAARPVEGNKVDVHVGGDISATNTDDKEIFNGATGINAEGVAGEATVTTNGSVNATGQTEAVGIMVSMDEEDDRFEINVGKDITATAEKTAKGVNTDIFDGTATVTAGGDITAYGPVKATAIEAVPYNGTATVTAGGNATAVSSFIATGVEAAPNTGNVTVNVGGNVTAESSGEATGVLAVPAKGNVTVNVGGDVTAKSEGDTYSMPAYGIYGDLGKGTSLTVHVGGGVTAATVGEDSRGRGVDLLLDAAKAEVEIGGDVAADDIGVKMRIGNEDDDRENHAASEGKVTVDGSIQVDGRGDPIDGHSGVKVDNYHMKATAEVDVGGDVKVADEDRAVAIDVIAGSGLVKVKTGGDISAISDGYTGIGVFVQAEKNGEAQVDVDGSVYAASEDQSGGVEVLAMEAGSKVKVTVADGITAESLTDEGEASGILVANYVKDGSSGEVDIRVSGDVNASHAGINVTGSAWEVQSIDGTAEIKEEEYLRTEYYKDETGTIYGYKVYYNAEENYYYNEYGDMIRPEEAETGLTRIEVKGDVTGGDFGLMMDGRAITDVIVDGTLSGGECAVALTDEKMAENLTLTVWEIKPNEEGILAGVGGLNEDGQYEIEELDDLRKQIQYIIRVEQPDAGAVLSTEGTFEYEGYNVAYEGDTVILKINLEPGYEIVDAYNGTDIQVSLLQDANGEYYLVVPRGGAVLLSVKLRKIVKKQAAAKNCTITIDPNGGTLNGNMEPVIETVGRFQSITLPEAPEKRDATFLGWYGTPFAATNVNWKAPEADSGKLLPAGSSVKVTRDYFYTAVWKAE